MVLSEPRWHPEAIVDAEEARNWYAARSPLAARGFLLALEEGIAAVMEVPEKGALVAAGADVMAAESVCRQVRQGRGH